MAIKSSTIVRTIVLVITLLNTILTAFGVNPLPFSDDQIYEIVSALVTVVVSLWAWWKNNSFTKAARVADEVLAEIKYGEDFE